MPIRRRACTRPTTRRSSSLRGRAAGCVRMSRPASEKFVGSKDQYFMESVWFALSEQRVPHPVDCREGTLGDLLDETARKYPYNTAVNFVLSYIAGEGFTVGGKLTYRKRNAL